jgi:hypothetical protein
VGMWISATTTESSVEALEKLKIELTHDPVIFPGIYPKERKSGYNRNTWILMFNSSFRISLDALHPMNG